MNPQGSVEPTATPILQPTQPPAPTFKPQNIGKFKASLMLFRESLGVLKQDKELMWFPLLSFITNIIVLGTFVAVFFFGIMGGDIHVFSSENTEQLGVLEYGFAFIYYILMSFISNYFITGIYTIVNARFNGQNLSFSDGIANANKHAEKIFIWALISSTVGMILQIISNKSKIIGKIIATIFGAAWSILTYFSLPSLVIGERSIKDSFKESASVIRKTWGETIIVNIGMGLFFGLIHFIVVILMISIAIVITSWEILSILGIIFVIYYITASIFLSTLSAIVKLALYQYAITGSVPQGFTPELIKGIVKASS